MDKNKSRILAGVILIAWIFVSALRVGGRDHFFEALPKAAWAIARFAAIIYSVIFLQWALTKTALKRGWTTEEKLRTQREAYVYAQRQSRWTALALLLWGMGAPIFLMWWFTNPIPGKPGLAKLDMVRIENAYWLMGVTQAIALTVVLVLGFRWVESRAGKLTHLAFSLIPAAMFLASYIFGRSEPNVILVIWAMTVTLFPSLHVFMLYRSAMKRRFLQVRDFTVRSHPISS